MQKRLKYAESNAASGLNNNSASHENWVKADSDDSDDDAGAKEDSDDEDDDAKAPIVRSCSNQC